MAEVLSFIFGAIVGGTAILKHLEYKNKKTEGQKYEKYKTSQGLYEGVKRK